MWENKIDGQSERGLKGVRPSCLGSGDDSDGASDGPGDARGRKIIEEIR